MTIQSIILKAYVETDKSVSLRKILLKTANYVPAPFSPRSR